VVLTAIVALGTAAAWAGTAYYGGMTGETGIPYNISGLSGAETSAGANITWVPNGDGSFNIVSNVGRKKGVFTLADGVTPMAITDPPAPGGWVAQAAIDVPTAGTFTAYDASVQNKRFFFGVELGPYNRGGADQLGVAGIEWSAENNSGGTNMAFRLKSDSNFPVGDTLSSDFPAETYNAIPSNAQRFEIRLSKNASGDLTIEYRVDYGAWQYFPTSVPAVANPITDAVLTAGLGAGTIDDASADTAAWSVRGPWTNVDPIYTGDGVPNINTGLDQDGDGTNNELDAFPGDANYVADTDSDDLPDEWELLYIGNLSENGYSNNDSDFINNFAELAQGFDPSLQDGPGLPAVGTLGRVLMISALALFGLVAVVIRTRKAHAH